MQVSMLVGEVARRPRDLEKKLKRKSDVAAKQGHT